MATFIEPLYKLAVLDSMSGIGCLRRRFRNLTTYVDRARGKGSHLADAAPCADIRSTVLPSLQADVFDALELDPEETSATLPAPGGAANAVRMERAAAARQARDHRSLVLTTATATFGSPTVRQTSAPSAVDRRKRDEVARGAVRGGDAGTSQLAAQGRGDRLGSSVELSGKAAGKHVASVSVGGGRRGPSAGAGRPTTNNSLRPGARVGRPTGSSAWGPTPRSSARGFLRTPLLTGAGRDPENAEILRTPHLTGSGRLWIARKWLLLLRSGGHVVRRGWRS
jgi:hypothetical protein